MAKKLRVNLYEIVSRAVDEGIDYGWTRAHKHVDTPDEDLIKMSFHDAIMNALCEVINFDD